MAILVLGKKLLLGFERTNEQLCKVHEKKAQTNSYFDSVIRREKKSYDFRITVF